MRSRRQGVFTKENKFQVKKKKVIYILLQKLPEVEEKPGFNSVALSCIILFNGSWF